MNRILARRHALRPTSAFKALQSDFGRFVAYGNMRAATRRVFEVERHLPVCVALVVPDADDMPFYEKALRPLAWRFADPFSIPSNVSIDILTSRSKSKPFEQAETYRAERVFVVSAKREFLPRDFEVTADLVAELPRASPRLLAGAARACLSVALTDDEAAEAATYPLAMVAMVFRKGRAPRKSLDMLRRLRQPSNPEVVDTKTSLTLDQLPGMGEAAEWGRQLAADLADWKSGAIQWSDVDRGILLSGPPGCGKTSFASALAATCDVPLILGSLARWQSKGHLGDMLKAMRGAFAEATKQTPSILFVDELDSFGDRDALRHSSNNEQYCREVINGFLECLDGAARREGVVVVGATNYPDAIDAGIRRPGRLDRHLVIPLPDEAARAAIFRLHLAVELAPDAIQSVAVRTAGWSGAALEQLARDARRLARRERRALTADDIRSSLPPLVALPEEVRRLAAVHEAGHALVGLALGRTVLEVSVEKEMEPAHAVTLGGSTVFTDTRTLIRTTSWFRDRIATLLAGAAAEELVLGERSTGAGGQPDSDLYLATVATLTMEASFGLGGGLTFLSGQEPRDLMATLQLNPDLRDRVEAVLQTEKERATGILRDVGISAIERLADRLFLGERLGQEALEESFDAQPRGP